MFACTVPEITPFIFTQKCPYKRRRTVCQSAKPTVRYQVANLPNEILVELKKAVPKATIEKHVLSSVRGYQDTIPRYRVVSDWFGNQYYVENNVDQEAVFNEALRSIDWNQLGKGISKKLFSDYNIELKHDGKELKVSSKKDEIDQIFELDEEVDDVEVTKICLTGDMNDAVLGLRLIKKVTVEEPVRSVGCHSDEDQAVSYNISMTEDSDSKQEPKEQQREEAVEPKKTEHKEHKKHRRHHHRHHRHHHRRSESQSDDESVQQNQSVPSPKVQAPAEESVLESAPTCSNGTYKIDIQFKDLKDASRETDLSSEESVAADNNNNNNNNNNKPSISRRGSSSSSGSVVLEEVEDEEHKRWQRSLSASPSGHSVLEDV